MTTLLIIIYIAFISLGLPDSVLGSAWPLIRAELNAPLPLAGYIAMVVSVGTVVSSLMSNRMIIRFGVGKVTAVSVLMTAAALLGFSVVPEAWMMFILAVPLGLGAGSVDSALNNFVALHYSARHMSWLHCFWGLGATAGPIILTAQLAAGNGWRGGYIVIGVLQAILTIALFVTLPLWSKAQNPAVEEETDEQIYISNREVLKLPGIGMALIAFIFFCAVEGTGGLWAASYVNAVKGMGAASAARASTMFYGAITLGRLISGFIAGKVTDAQLIRWGQILCVFGALAIILSPNAEAAIWGIALVGFGTSPIYPSMIHETPRRFGAMNSQAVIGLEMAFAYIGSVCLPPLFGQLAKWFSPVLYPWYLLVCTLIMLICSEGVQMRLRKRETKK